MVDAPLKKFGELRVGNVAVCKKFTRVNRLHDINALAVMFVTELGIVMEARFVQIWNALVPIFVTVLGIVTEVSCVQLLNSDVLILVIEPSVAEVRDVQF